MSVSKYDIAANVAVAGLDGFSGRLPAAKQREVFGRNVFGKKTITIDASGQGRVHGVYSVCFGTDIAFFDTSFEEIARLANQPASRTTF